MNSDVDLQNLYALLDFILTAGLQLIFGFEMQNLLLDAKGNLMFHELRQLVLLRSYLCKKVGTYLLFLQIPQQTLFILFPS